MYVVESGMECVPSSEYSKLVSETTGTQTAVHVCINITVTVISYTMSYVPHLDYVPKLFSVNTVVIFF